MSCSDRWFIHSRKIKLMFLWSMKIVKLKKLYCIGASLIDTLLNRGKICYMWPFEKINSCYLEKNRSGTEIGQLICIVGPCPGQFSNVETEQLCVCPLQQPWNIQAVKVSEVASHSPLPPSTSPFPSPPPPPPRSHVHASPIDICGSNGQACCYFLPLHSSLGVSKWRARTFEPSSKPKLWKQVTLLSRCTSCMSL